MAKDLGNNITEKESYLSSANMVPTQVIDFLPDATLAVNTNGEVIIWNRAMEELTGVKANDILGKGNYEYALPFYGKRRPILADLALMPEDQIAGRYDKIQRDGSTLTIEIFIPTFGLNGAYIWAKAAPLYDSLGNVIGAIESIRDITERKKSEETILRSEQEKAAILGGLKNVSVEYLDPEMRIIWLSDAVQRHIGLSAEEIKGRNCFKVIQGLDEPCPGCTAVLAVQMGQSQEGELLTPDGRSWISRSSPIKEDGQIKGAVHVAVNITQIKLAEQKVCSMKQRLAQIIDFLPDATLAIDNDGKIVTWNKAMEKLTGAKAEDMLDKGNYEHALPFYGVRRPILADLVLMPVGQFTGNYNKIQRDGKTITAEIFIPTFGPKGSYIWAKATPLYDSSGRITGAIESIRDITERKKLEEALLKSEQEKAAILGGLKNVAVEYLDPEMRIIWLNDAVQKRLGLSAEEIKGKNCFELIQGLNEPCPGCTAVKAIQTGQSQEGELLTPDGKAWVSRSSPIKDLKGHVKGVVHVAVNITQRKRAEEKLANIIDFLPDATFVMDINSKVIAWNRALEELTGVKAKEMIGKGDYEYALPFYGSRRPMLIDLAMMPEVEVDDKYSNLQREGNTLITEVYIPTFGQGGANLWAKATPLYDTAGKLMGAIESVRDMTLLRRAEKTLERSKAELRIASDIQRSFLPEHIPPVAGFDMAAISIPAMEVGGDFYDFIPGNGSVGMVIADVSGKSIPAALFMALSRTIVRANATHHERGIDVLQEANDMISADSHSGMFVTLFYGVLDQSSRDLVYANAGHPPPILLRGGSDEIVKLDVTGIALGAISGVEYEERKVALLPGDMVILYTDGVTEAINSDVEQYGLKRLCTVAQRYRNLSSQGIIEKILEDISQFSGEQAQFDDITMIIAKAEQDKSSINNTSMT